MRISDWSSDVCSSDLAGPGEHVAAGADRPDVGAAAVGLTQPARKAAGIDGVHLEAAADHHGVARLGSRQVAAHVQLDPVGGGDRLTVHGRQGPRSEEHTSELQSLMRISYAVFCLKKKNEK